MRFSDLNWMDIEKYLKGDDRVILPLGACEQHGYLSLQTDIQIPEAFAHAAAQQTGVLVAPSVNFGISPYFLDYPGTISLRLSTMVSVVEDVVRSLHRQGFRRFLMLNGHGGNSPVQHRIQEIANELTDLQVAWFSWWRSVGVQDISKKYDLKPGHANWLEAFPFTRVAALPDGSKPFAETHMLLSAGGARELYKDGSFGGKYLVEEEVMDALFAAVLQELLTLLEFMPQMPMSE
jgi:creatinine amidohydrolase